MSSPPPGSRGVRGWLASAREEFQQRDFFKTIVAYCGTGMGLLTGTTTLFEQFGLPEGLRKAVLGVEVFVVAALLLHRWAEGKPRRRSRMALWLGVVAGVAACGFLAYRVFIYVPPPPSLVVLPLGTAGGSAQAQQFADGIADGVTYRLGKVHGLAVVGSLSADAYRGVRTLPEKVAAELGVRFVLGVGAESVEGMAVVNVDLFDSRTRRSTWSDRYTKPFTSRMDLEREVAEEVAEALDARLLKGDRTRLRASPTRSDSAYRLYTRGRDLLYSQRDTRRRNEEAISLFQQALRLDPRFGLAYAGLARGYQVRSHDPGAGAWSDSALAAARRAVALPPREERAYASLGVVLRERGWLHEALGVLRRAADLSPSGGDGSGRSNVGQVYLELGYPDSAVVWGKRSSAVEPRSSTARLRVGVAYQALGDYGGAQWWYRHALAADSTALDARYRLAVLAWMRGDPAAGEPLMGEVRRLEPGSCLLFQWQVLNGRAAAPPSAAPGGAPACDGVLTALALRPRGDEGGARAVLAAVENAQRDSIVQGHEGARPRLVLAQVYALRGDLPSATLWFAEAVEHGYRDALEASRLPGLAPLRGTAAFERHLAEMRSTVSALRTGLARTDRPAG
ncbi:MAG TPA: hypothetical protein VFJ82_04980 [Longimicrobium sp.]|nr:hypothetical protein [Longimicrobium sp.]